MQLNNLIAMTSPVISSSGALGSRTAVNLKFRLTRSDLGNPPVICETDISYDLATPEIKEWNLGNQADVIHAVILSSFAAFDAGCKTGPALQILDKIQIINLDTLAAYASAEGVVINNDPQLLPSPN